MADLNKICTSRQQCRSRSWRNI